MKKTIDAMYEILIRAGLTYSTADEFEGLITLCVKKNIFQFDGKVFRLPDLPMGGPLSSLMANVLMDHLERWVMTHCTMSSRVVLWARYVDNVFRVWDDTDEELEKFHTYLHRFDPSIKSTSSTISISLCH